jgi:primosomal protein N' (replication factor Y)
VTSDGGGTGLIPGLHEVAARPDPTLPSGGTAAAPATRTARKGERRPAAELPVARVAVDVPLPHLDRPFDYLVPDKLDTQAVPGCRVRVRFAGRLVDGYVLERVEQSEHDGRLLYLERVTSPTGTPGRWPTSCAWRSRPGMPAWRPSRPPGPRSTGTSPPAPGHGRNIRQARPSSRRSGKDAPQGRSGPRSRATTGRTPSRAPWRRRWRADAAPWSSSPTAVTSPASTPPSPPNWATDLGPTVRYRRWLKVRRGNVSAVVGTRATMFAPVHDLGLVVLWDDGDDVHAEPHAPYPHPREVLALRAHRAGAGALFGGFTRTTDTTRLVETGWAHALAADRAQVRAVMPRVRPAGEDGELARDAAARTARLGELAFRTARAALADGPVLVQVPRRGYVPGLACGRCREAARCTACQGPLALTSSHAAPSCRWCGRIAGDWHCPECGHFQVRAVAVGARRTAEEMGRAFPGVPVRTSGRDQIRTEVSAEPALVVATPGAEPVAADGYAAALLLDGRVLLARPDLRAGEEALRRWMHAAALVRPGGAVVIAADGALRPVQALVRWDPATYAELELAERREAGFPPAARMASLTASPAALRELLADARLPDGAEVLGPVPVEDGKERALVRVPPGAASALARALRAAAAVRSARRADEVVRVRIDPLELI